MNLKGLLNITESLTIVEKKKLIGLIESSIYTNRIDSVRSSIIEDNISCPKCNSKNLHRHGTYRGRLRFKCVSCTKTFNEQTGTSIDGIKKRDKWTRFIELTLESKSIRDICKDLDLAMQTVFDWRHKVLSSIEDVFTKQFEGIIEMDDAYFRFNQKGRKSNFLDDKRIVKGQKKKRGLSKDQVSVLFTTDRQGTMGTSLLKLGKISLASVKANIEVGRFHEESIIVTDKDHSLISWAKSSSFESKFINSSANEYVKEGVFHIQHVNNLIKRFKEWLKLNFSSVATKYLKNYLNYFKIIQIVKNSTNSIDELLTYSLQKTNISFNFIEADYQAFI